MAAHYIIILYAAAMAKNLIPILWWTLWNSGSWIWNVVMVFAIAWLWHKLQKVSKVFCFHDGMKHEMFETKSKNIKWKTSRLIRFSHMVNSFTHEFCRFFFSLRNFIFKLEFFFWWKMPKKVKVVDSLMEKIEKD